MMLAEIEIEEAGLLVLLLLNVIAGCMAWSLRIVGQELWWVTMRRGKLRRLS
jgi:hypothetical protein